MRIYYIGNQVTGMIGKLTILAEGHTIVDTVEESDILLCVHGRKIIPRRIFEKPEIAAINIHPYLYAYKGADPVGRAIRDRNWRASVGCHCLSEQIDNGKLIHEVHFYVEPSENRCEIYNQLYPYYSQVIADSLKLLEREYLDNLEEPDVLVGGIGY